MVKIELTILESIKLIWILEDAIAATDPDKQKILWSIRKTILDALEKNKTDNSPKEGSLSVVPVTSSE